MGSKGSPQVFGGIVASVRKRYEGGAGGGGSSELAGVKGVTALHKGAVARGVPPPTSTPGTRRFRATTRLSLNHASVASTPAAAVANAVRVDDTTSSSQSSNIGCSNTSSTASRASPAFGRKASNIFTNASSSNCSSPLLRQASDSGVSITSSIGGDEENSICAPAESILSSSPQSASDCSVIELTSAKLKELDDFNRQLIAELASQTLRDNSSSSCNSLLEAARAEEVAAEAVNQIREDTNWKTAWKELAGVTPSRRLLQLMRRLQAKWSSDSSNTALAHVTLTRGAEGSARPFLRGSALLDSSQRVAVASPSGALVASRGGQVRSYVNTNSLSALRQDLINNSKKTNSEQNNDLVCLTTDSNQKWQTLEVDNMTHQRSHVISPPTRPNRIKLRAPPVPQYNRRGSSPQLDHKLPPSPQMMRKQPPSPQLIRKHPPSPHMNRSKPPSPQLPIAQPTTPHARRRQPTNPQTIRAQPPSPIISRKQPISQQPDGTQVIRVQPPPSPRLGRSQPSSQSPFRRSAPSPQMERVTPLAPPRSRDTSINRSSDSLLDPRSQRSSPGLPRACGPISSPRELIAPSRGRCPQAKSALHNPRSARSQTRGDTSRPTHRGSSQPPAPHKDSHLNMSSKLKQDVLAAFGVKLNGVSRTLPRQLSSSSVFNDVSTVHVPVSPYQYDDERKLSLESTSSGISGCSEDSFNAANDSTVNGYIEHPEVVTTGMGFSPHAHLHQQASNDSSQFPLPLDKRHNINNRSGRQTNGDNVMVLSERSSPSQCQRQEHELQPPPGKRRMSSSRLASSALSQKPHESQTPRAGLSDFTIGSNNSTNSSGSNDSNKENKKHRSRVHLGGDNPSPIGNNDVSRNNFNNAITNGNKPIKATTISINMGPVQQHMYGAPVTRTSHRQSKQSPSSSRQSPSIRSSATSKTSSPVKKPSQERRSISNNNNTDIITKANRSTMGKEGLRKNSRDDISDMKWNGGGGGGNKSCNTSANSSRQCSSVSSSSGRRDTVTNNRVSRDDRTTLRRDYKPVSRLVRKGTFRIVETRGENGQDITPSIRLRYLMQRAQSGDDSSSSQPDTSPPSPTQLDLLAAPIHDQQVRIPLHIMQFMTSCYNIQYIVY